MAKNLYEILGMAKTASDEQLRDAFAALIQREPPLDAVQRLAVKEAFATLIHPQRRAAYDASLHADVKRRPMAGDSTAARPSSARPLWLGLGVLLVAGGWWALRPPKLPTAAPKVVWSAAPTELAAPGAPAATAAPAPATRVLGAEELFARTAPSVVRVNALSDTGDSLAVGSGVVIDAATVVTNCHVVKRGTSVKVGHQNTQFTATVTVADEAHDLCKLSVPGLAAPAVAVGRVAGLRVGQKVYAIGSPQGLDLTLSDGMVSSLREGPDGTFVQTTAPISPGSSGGGLFDETGTLVGIVTFQMRNGQNLNFALPADWIGQMSPTAPRGAEREAVAAPAAVPPAPVQTVATLILGRWTCFGPLTGRGLELNFETNNVVSGSGDGKPIRGRWFVQNRQLQLLQDLFQIEDIDASRMVLTQGQGRRLVCNH